MQREQDLWIYGTFFAPLLIELGGTLIYQGGQVLLRVGSRFLSLERINALYNDICLRAYFQGNYILNTLKSDLIAAIAGTFFKNNPGTFDKLMQQSGKFTEWMNPILNQIQKWNEKNPHGQAVNPQSQPYKTINKLVF